MDTKRLVKIYQHLKEERQAEVADIWRLLGKYVCPLRGEFYEGIDPGTSKADFRLREIYDSTAIDAWVNLAAMIQGSMISPGNRWFDLRFRNHEKLEIGSDVKEWLDSATETCYYSLMESNFNMKSSEALLDLVGLGNMFISEEEIEGELDFTAIPVRESYFEEGYRGTLSRYFRRLDWTALKLAEKFGLENLPDHIKKEYEEGDGSKKYEIIWCVYHRPENKEVDTMKDAAPKAMAVGGKYILVNEGQQLGDDLGYHEMPVYATKWRASADSIWGHGPGTVCMSTILEANQWNQALIEAAEKMIEPPVMTTQSGVLGDLDMRRGGVTVVSDMNDLAPLPVGGDLNAGFAIVQELRNIIRKSFFQDKLELKNSPAMTATESLQRYELLNRLLGATVGRLQSDFLDPMISRTLRILMRNGTIPPYPESLKNGDKTVDIKYLGPLARSVRADKASAIAGWIGQIASLAEVKPSLLDLPDWEQSLRIIGAETGVPAIAINSKTEVKSIRDKREAEQKKQNNLVEAQEQGKALKELGAGAAAINPEAAPAETIAALQEASQFNQG